MNFKTIITLASTVLFLVSCGGAATKPSSAAQDAPAKAYPKNAKVLWNGNPSDVDSSWAPGSWSAVSDQNLDTIDVSISDEDGYGDSKSLKVDINGKQWMGFGWNWMGAWSGAEGMDISSYDAIAFQVKITGVKPVDEGTIGFHLNSHGPNANGNMSKAHNIKNIARTEYRDGNWHQVVLPLSKVKNTSLQGGNSGSFDITQAKEIDFSINPQQYVDFTMFIDDIILLK